MPISVIANELDVRAWCGALQRGDPHAIKSLGGGSVPFGGTSGGSGGGMTWFGDGTVRGFGGSPEPGARANYQSRAGALHKNSVVAACLGWIVDNFGQAILQVSTDDPKKPGEVIAIPDHPLVAMLKRPNEYYSARTLWGATVAARKLTGTAYWLKIPAGGPGGPTIGVRWLSPWTTRPKIPKGVTFSYIDGYEYKDGQDWKDIPGGKDAVVCFRDGISMEDERLGWNRLNSVLRQISATNEGSTYTASLLENMGIVPYLFTGTKDEELSETNAGAIDQWFHGASGGQNRGRSLFSAFPVEATQLGSSPQDMALESILDRPVSEICAMMRLSPMVIGFPDDARTYSNFAEARRAAHEDCIIPLQDSIADDLQHQLLAEFGDDATQTVGWNRSRIQALAEDRTEAINRAVVAFQGGLCNLAAAQSMGGLEVSEGADDQWYQAPGASGQPEPEPDVKDDAIDEAA